MYAFMHLYLSIQFVNIDDIFELIAELFRYLKMFPFIRTPLGQTFLSTTLYRTNIHRKCTLRNSMYV